MLYKKQIGVGHCVGLINGKVVDAETKEDLMVDTKLMLLGIEKPAQVCINEK